MLVQTTILGMSLVRFITIYIAQGILFAFFVYLAYKILKRDTKRLNLVFAGTYISVSIGLFVNFIYGPLTDLNAVYTLNFVTNFFLWFSPIFLMVFNLILLKSEKIITTKKQEAIILVYGVLMFGMIFFPWNDPIMGIYFAEPQSSPVWSVPFYLYVVMVMTIITTVPTLYFSFKIYEKFEDEVLKSRWKYFIIGAIEIYIFMYGIITANMLNIAMFRTVMGLIGIFLCLTGGYLIYYGVGRQIEK